MTDKEKIAVAKKFYVNRKGNQRKSVKGLLRELLGRPPTEEEINEVMTNPQPG